MDYHNDEIDDKEDPEDPRDTTERFGEIIHEIMELVGVGRSPIRHYINAPGQENGLELLDARLQEVMDNLHTYTTGELTCYIRGSYTSSNDLKNWAPLLTAARAQSKLRGETGNAFFGLNEDRPYKSSFS
jgi:hypothetical protein